MRVCGAEGSVRVSAWQSVKRGAIVSAVVLACALMSAPALASATPSNAAIVAKQAQQMAVLSQIAQMRITLQAKIDEYIDTGRKIQDTQVEVDKATADLAQVDQQLADSKLALTERAVELYRSDRVGMLELLLSSKSLEDLIVKTHYLLLISERDAGMMGDYRLTRSESLWLQDSLLRRVERLRQLQAIAETERKQIESGMASQEAKASSIGVDIVNLMRQQQAAAAAAAPTGGTPDTTLNPDLLISDAKFRSQDMTAGPIQRFLNAQPGTLKSYSAADYHGVQRTAAEMIADAGAHWNVSPKVILATLQKEQSLLSDPSPSTTQHNWAMGCGATDSGKIMKYQGFGKQIWWGAQKLNKNAQPWHSGITMKIDGSTIRPQNEATYSQYMYTPHLHGTRSFWLLYWRYFGDPVS